MRLLIIFFANKDKNYLKEYEPTFYIWLLQHIEEKRIINYFDRVLTLDEYERFMKYLGKFQTMSEEDLRYLNDIIDNSEKIEF